MWVSQIPDDPVVARWWREADARADLEEAVAGEERTAEQAKRLRQLRRKVERIDEQLLLAASASEARRYRRRHALQPAGGHRVIRTREYNAHLEVRDDGRTLEGVAVPYGQEAQIGRYVEVFARGAFMDAGIHPLTASHPRTGADLPIGRSVELREEPDGLHGAWHVSETELGNEVLTLVRDGVPLGLSIGFVEGRSRWNRDHTRVERVTAFLDHVAVVRSPAYASARVHAVRVASGIVGDG